MKKTKKTYLKQDVYNIKGEVVGRISLPKEIFSIKPNPVLMRQAVHVYLANQRLGSHSTKTRSEVSGSTRKIYRQKGTGRARHGDRKAPIFRKGGIAHGPKPRDYSLKLSKQMRRLALFSALVDKLHSDKLKIVTGVADIDLKTKKILEVLKNLQVIETNGEEKLSVLLVLPKKIDNILLASRNLEGLKVIQAKLLNTYEVLQKQNFIFMKEALEVFENHFVKKK